MTVHRLCIIPRAHSLPARNAGRRRHAVRRPAREARAKPGNNVIARMGRVNFS